jgi:hypothetical protein
MTTPRSNAARDAGADARCACGSLLARILPHGVELKCRRCRRHALVTLDASGAFVVQGALVDDPGEAVRPPRLPRDRKETP